MLLYIGLYCFPCHHTSLSLTLTFFCTVHNCIYLCVSMCCFVITELRSPMNGVIAMAELLASMPMDDEQLDIVNTIRTSGSSMMTLIEDLLTFSKMEAGRHNISIVIFLTRPGIDPRLFPSSLIIFSPWMRCILLLYTSNA
jgi:hypothetical protein